MPALLLTLLAKLGIKNKYLAYAILSIAGIGIFYFYGVYQFRSGVSHQKELHAKKELQDQLDLAKRKNDAQDKSGVIFYNSMKDRLEKSNQIEKDLSSSLTEIETRYETIVVEKTCTPDDQSSALMQQREYERALAISQAQWRAYCVGRLTPECKPYQFK